MGFFFAFYAFCLVLSIFIMLYRWRRSTKINLRGKSVVITGGTSGVGLALAQACLDALASDVVLIARGEKGLSDAIASLFINEGQKVHAISADVSNWESLSEAFARIKMICARLDFVFVNAGFARPGLLKNMRKGDLDSQLNVNFLGAAYTARLALPLLVRGSHIVFSGSVCSILSFAGYSGYGSAKYAVRGLAETLRNELKPNGIHVHIALLSPVDTPGLSRENEIKPEVCAAIEGTATLFAPDDVAKRMMRGIFLGDYAITMEFLSWLVLEANSGIIPSSNIFLSLLIAPFIPIIRWVAVLYIDWMVRRSSKEE